MYNILLVGSGGIGSRHLQGLFFQRKPIFKVDVIEPRIEAYEHGVSMLDRSFHSNVRRIEALEFGHDEYDATIIASSAQNRSILLKDIVSKISCQRYLIEKVLAQSVPELRAVRRTMQDRYAWINSPRREAKLYTLLRSLCKQEKITLEVRWPNFGLACNSIHFIDLVGWLSENKILKINIECDEGWYDSKREGYQDFSGELFARYSNGSTLKIISDKNYDKVIKLTTNNNTFIIDEATGFIDKNGQRTEAKLKNQSEISGSIVEKMITSPDEMQLPDIEESIDNHMAFFDAMSRCECLNMGLSKWPIT